MLNNTFMYTITDNCIVRGGQHGNVLSLFGKDIKEDLTMQVDNRMSLVSYNSTMDLTEYFRYFNIVSISAGRKLASEDFMKGNFIAMLDNGYVPFYMPPTYMPKDLGDKFRELVVKTGIDYIEEKAMRFDGLKVDSQANDIWVSRPDAARYAKWNLSEFNTLKFMEGVWSGAYN